MRLQVEGFADRRLADIKQWTDTHLSLPITWNAASAFLCAERTVVLKTTVPVLSEIVWNSWNSTDQSQQ